MQRLINIRRRIAAFHEQGPEMTAETLVNAFTQIHGLITQLERNWQNACANTILSKNISYSFRPLPNEPTSGALKSFHLGLKLVSKKNAVFLRLWPDLFSFYSLSERLFCRRRLDALATRAMMESKKYTAPLVRRKDNDGLSYDAEICKIMPEGIYAWPLHTDYLGLIASSLPSGELVKIENGVSHPLNIPGTKRDTFCKFMWGNKIFIFSRTGGTVTIIDTVKGKTITSETGITQPHASNMFFAPFKNGFLSCSNSQTITLYTDSFEVSQSITQPQFKYIRGPVQTIGGNTFLLNTGTVMDSSELLQLHPQNRFSCVYDLLEDTGQVYSSRGFVTITDNSGIHLLKIDHNTIKKQFYIPLGSILLQHDPWDSYPNAAVIAEDSLKIFIRTSPPGNQEKQFQRLASIRFAPGALD